MTPVAGRCAVLPTGNFIELVELNVAIALVTCVVDPKLAVSVPASVKKMVVVSPLTAKFTSPLVPLTVIAAAELVMFPPLMLRLS